MKEDMKKASFHNSPIEFNDIFVNDNRITFVRIGVLSKSTSNMAAALEMGEISEQYFAEGNYALALDKFKSCLGVLVRVLAKEPPGRRRDLLHQQVNNYFLVY